MTIFRTPIWDDLHIKLALLDEGDEWTQSAFVRIPKAVTVEALQRAPERMSNVHYLKVDSLHLSLEDPFFSFLEAASVPNLRVLNMDVPVSQPGVTIVTNKLRNKMSLEQLRLIFAFDRPTNENEICLFDVLKSSPLTALRMEFMDKLYDKSSEKLCELLQQKRDTLVSLELDSMALSVDGVHNVASEGLLGMMKLQHLTIYCHPLDDSRMKDLCKALSSKPRLKTLKLKLCGVTSLRDFFMHRFAQSQCWRPKSRIRSRMLVLSSCLKP